MNLLDLTTPILLVGGLVYAAWYWYFYCVQKGDRVYIMQGQPIPAIYPPPNIQAPAYDLPLYLPRPPLLPAPSNDTCGFPCGLFNPPNCQNIPPVCQALPLCVQGFVNNPLTCGCTPECQVVQQGSSIICPQGSRWNWCVKGCVPAASMMPDCAGPPCAA